MAQHKSAEKQARTSIKKNLRNRSYLSKVKSAVKKFHAAAAALKDGKTSLDDARKVFAEAQSMLMKAATKHVLHKNSASRRVARMSKLLGKEKSA